MLEVLQSVKSGIRGYEERIAMQALAQKKGDKDRAFRAIVKAIREMQLDSLDRYLLFNVGRWALENWQLENSNTYEQQLTEAMQVMHQRELDQPERKPPEWETAADLRESGSLHSKLRRKSDKRAS